MTARLEPGDCLDILPRLIAEGLRVEAIVTDPPYHLTSASRNGSKRQNGPGKPYGRHRLADSGFMGKTWDGGDIAFRPEVWRLCLEALKPGGHLLSFGGTRTYHRMACAIEDAGFEIRDQIGWLYGSGFPKSHNLGSEWQGWGTALKPAWEPIVLARKPFKGTVAANVQEYGTGAINVDGCRVETAETIKTHSRGKTEAFPKRPSEKTIQESGRKTPQNCPEFFGGPRIGRWPANVIHDGSEEVLAAFPAAPGQQGAVTGAEPSSKTNNVYGQFDGRPATTPRGDTGTAARFFYCSKAGKDDRLGSKHPTVKPIDLIAYLCRLVTPPGGTVLDPFAGSGTLASACAHEGFNCVLIEREAEYIADIQQRLAHIDGANLPLVQAAP